jgi:hypothetical protein
MLQAATIAALSDFDSTVTFKEIGKPQQCKHKPHRNKYAEIKHHQLDCKCNQAWSILFQNTSRLYLAGLKQLSVELVAGFADFSKGTKFGKPREGCKS